MCAGSEMAKKLNAEELEKLRAFIAAFPKWHDAPEVLQIDSISYFLVEVLGRSCVRSSGDHQQAFEALRVPMPSGVWERIVGAGNDYVPVHQGYALAHKRQEYIRLRTSGGDKAGANDNLGASPTEPTSTPTSWWRKALLYVVHHYFAALIVSILAGLIVTFLTT